MIGTRPLETQLESGAERPGGSRGGRSAAPAPHAARARQPRPGGHAGPVSSTREASGLGAQRRGQRSGGVPTLGGASEGSRERLALGVSACARLKTAAARSSRHPGPTLSEYQAAGFLLSCFSSPQIQSGQSTPISFQGKGETGPGVPSHTQVFAAMGAVMGTFSSLQTKQRRPSKGKFSVLRFLPWRGSGVLGVVLGCNVCLL